ncbi:MAG: polyprenyl synthetase family protein [Bradymonadaceae bacterium]
MRAPKPTSGERSDFVHRVTEELRREVGAEDGDRGIGQRIRSDASRHLCLSTQAKRARPRLVRYAAQMVDLEEDEMLDLAVAAELVHSASLLHDDVVDGGTERRGRPTVNVEWNEITAVLAGDALFCGALQRLEQFPRAVTESAVDVIDEMTAGIMHEVAIRRRPRLDREHWWEVAEGKTGALFGWCTASPALAARRPRLAVRLERCGRHLGLAFQLVDDLHDVTGGDGGEDPYADIVSGDCSFPVLSAVEEDPSIADALDRLWEGDAVVDPSDIADQILRTEAVDRTRAAVRDEVDAALDALAPFDERPGGHRIAQWAERLRDAV